MTTGTFSQQLKARYEKAKEFAKTPRFEKLIVAVMCTPFAVWLLCFVTAAIIFRINHPSSTWNGFFNK